MQIHGPTQVHGPQPINSPHRAAAPAQAGAASGSAGGTDEVTISHEADALSRVREVPDIRADRVAEIRAAIQAGTYETPDKLEIAVGRLLDELSS
jgi:negative regulator of flagellin synthesis FlgM